MDVGSINRSMQSVVQLGNMLKDISAKQTGLTEKMVGVAVEQRVSIDTLGTLADYRA